MQLSKRESSEFGMDRDDYSSLASSNTALSRQQDFQARNSSSAPSSRSGTPKSQRFSPGNLGRPAPSSGLRQVQASQNGGASWVAGSSPLSTGRVKVGVRCRPAFEDEIAYAEQRGNAFSSIITSYEENPNASGMELGRVSLTMMSGKPRDFIFDYVFPPETLQNAVYERLAMPVVNDVLKGFNGTIFAYGQTGTGKTYTMGILETVADEQAGIIPRALAQLFDHIQAPRNDYAEITVTLSFLQLYRETIQDLLAPATASSNEENLQIREDPRRGFYVEGLQEFIVRDYQEAEALVNLGLENRAIAPTLMNSTSSRSHTVLTLNIEQRGASSADEESSLTKGNLSRIVRSKLLLVDLAGSERVRRTVSRGTRLNEARSINSSLSALGNVIAALADGKQQHIPYRDSKLTRLLQDSLGGTASTALVATVGPSSINYGETLSTLLFAARCMAVSTTPVQHEEVDYPHLCAKLQQRITTLESQMAERSMELQDKYEKTILQLQARLDGKPVVSGVAPSASGRLRSDSYDSADQSDALRTLLSHLSGTQRGGKAQWLQEAVEEGQENSYLLPLLGYCLSLLRGVATDVLGIFSDDQKRYQHCKKQLVEILKRESEEESLREEETAKLSRLDPLNHMPSQRGPGNAADGRSDYHEPLKIGGHVASLSRLEAITRVEGMYRVTAPADPVGGLIAAGKNDMDSKRSLTDFDDAQELAGSLANIHAVCLRGMQGMSDLLLAKDAQLAELKNELVSQMVERRQREEEVVNWSCILKYLLSTTSKLRSQLKAEQNYNQRIRGNGEGSHFIDESGRKQDGFVSASTTPSGTPLSMQNVGFSRLIAPDSVTIGSIYGDPNDPASVDKYRAAREALDSPLERVRERMQREQRLQQRSMNGDNTAGDSVSAGRRRTSGRANNLVERMQLNSASRRTNYNAEVLSQTESSFRYDDDDDDYDELETIDSQSDFGNRDESRGKPGNQEAAVARGRPSGPSAQRGKPARSPSPIIRSSIGSKGNLPPRSGSARNASRRYESPTLNGANISAIEPIKSSGLAQSVVKDLGVSKGKADAAAQVVDKVMQITQEQLASMDASTREQILLVRKELGLENLYKSENNRKPKGTSTRGGRDDRYEDDFYSQI